MFPAQNKKFSLLKSTDANSGTSLDFSRTIFSLILNKIGTNKLYSWKKKNSLSALLACLQSSSVVCWKCVMNRKSLEREI